MSKCSSLVESSFLQRQLTDAGQFLQACRPRLSRLTDACQARYLTRCCSADLRHAISRRHVNTATGSRLGIILLVLQQFLHKNVELFAQRLDRVVRVLPELLAVLDLRLQQFTQLLVIVLQLLVAQGLAKNVLAVRERRNSLIHVRGLALLGGALGLFANVLLLAFDVLADVSTSATRGLLADRLSEVV